MIVISEHIMLLGHAVVR